MKSARFGLFASLLFSFVTFAQTQALNGPHQNALKFTQDAIADHSLHGPQSPKCPAAGINTIESSQIIEGRLTSAKKALTTIESSLNNEAGQFKNEVSKCGQCKQHNVVTPITVTRPRNLGAQTQTCDNRPIELVRSEFASRTEAEEFVKVTLDKGNHEGERIYAGCPDPCSFYVYNAMTPLENGKTRLQLVVQCGQPRSGLLAKYIFSGALVHEWTCSK